MKRKIRSMIIPLLLCLCMGGCVLWGEISSESRQKAEQSIQAENLGGIPAFSDIPYAAVNENVPLFTDEELSAEPFEQYSELDRLGRCGTALAVIGQELMPTEERGQIGHIKPSGWQYTKYVTVDGKYLYNRCHLIGYQLTGENDNARNLITGTRYFNTQGMLPFENQVADYVKETGHHVLYRVTPIYKGNNLVASGVTMEAKSVEDAGEGIQFYVYVYNHQPGICVDYTTGESQIEKAEKGNTVQEKNDAEQEEKSYILNTNTKKFHKPSCSSASDMNKKNKQEYSGGREDLIQQGYAPCKFCNP